VEILALYTSADALGSALAAGARHLAATVDGFALVYSTETPAGEPDGWAGFGCARDAEAAGRNLEDFLSEAQGSDRPLRSVAPLEPPRIWARAKGGVFAFPLRHDGRARGVALVGCPGPWPRIRTAEIESILQQLALVLDHNAIASSQTETQSQSQSTTEDPSDELLRLSEQLLAQDLALIEKDEKIGEVERNKSDLIEKISAELRNPLNGIIERIISVLASEHENLPEASRSALRGALDDANGLILTLQNILDLWHMKQGDIRIEMQDVNLYEVVDEAIFNVRDSLTSSVDLEKRLPAGLPKVQTDLAKLNQILFHVLDNAAKFTPRGGILIELFLEEGQLLCNGSDTGIGIAQDDLDLIFDEFYQVDAPADGRYRGAGLGLTITRGLVERLGGAISVSSEVGRGTRVSFTLPVRVGPR
jgi:signal transduction histidine kinase